MPDRDLLEAEIAAQGLARHHETHTLAGHPEEGTDREIQHRGVGADPERLADRRARRVELEREAAAQRDAAVGRQANLGAQTARDASRQDEKHAFAVVNDQHAVGEAHLDAGGRHADDALAQRIADLLECEPAAQLLAEHAERRRARRGAGLDAQVRTGRQPVGRRRGGVHAQRDRSAHGNARDVEDDSAAELTRRTRARDDEGSAAARQRQHRRTVAAQAGGNVARLQTDDRVAAGIERALEREVAAERLADERQADARPGHAQVRALRQLHLNGHDADPQRLVDGHRAGVELDLQRSADRDPRHVEGDGAGDLAEHAGRHDEDRARSIAHGEEIGGAVAEGQRHAGRADADHLDIVAAARHAVGAERGHLLEREVAGQRLAEHREDHAVALHAHIRTDGQVEGLSCHALFDKTVLEAKDDLRSVRVAQLAEVAEGPAFPGGPGPHRSLHQQRGAAGAETTRPHQVFPGDRVDELKGWADERGHCV